MSQAPLLSRRLFLGSAAGAAIATSVRAVAQPMPERLTPAAMRADLALLRDAYEQLHPGLLRYQTAADTRARFTEAAESVARPLTRAQFYLLLSRLLATVRCGHSYANFFNQTDRVASALFDAPDRLPFDFLWLGDRMVVTADPFGTGFAPGSEILSIDGRPARAILTAVMAVARADGHNDAKRRRLMSVQGGERYESFDIFFSLMFGGRAHYRLAVTGPDGRRRAARVAASSLAQRRQSAGGTPELTDDQPAWRIERRGEVAVLTMPSWALYDSRWDWRGWLDETIDRLIAERVPRLVVDLRANEGGQDCGNALAARLIERSVRFEAVRRLVRYRSVPATLRPHLDTWDRRFDRLGETATRFDDRFLELPVEPGDGETIVPTGRRYPGQVRVLIGPQNSSATFQFASLVKRAGFATLVGEPTGGNRRGINGGCFYFLRLPETGLEADLPLVGRFPQTPQPDAGVAPDILVPRTRAGIAAGRDEAMSLALQGLTGARIDS